MTEMMNGTHIQLLLTTNMYVLRKTPTFSLYSDIYTNDDQRIEIQTVALIWTPHRKLTECPAIHYGCVANSCPAFCGRVNLNVFTLHPHILQLFPQSHAAQERLGIL